MTTKEKIENAKKRINELEQLIKLWTKDEIDKVFVKDNIELSLTEMIMAQQKFE